MFNQDDDTKYDIGKEKTDDNIDIKINNNENDSMVETVYAPTEPFTPGRNYSRVGLGMLLFIIVWQIIVTVVSLIIHKMTDKSIPMNIALTLSFAGELIGVVICYLCINKIKYEKIPEKKLPLSHLFCCFCIALFIGIAGNIIGIVLNSVISSGGLSPSLDNIDRVAKESLPALIVYGALIAPVIEEILCRKLVLDRIYKYNKSIAVISSGLIFGLIHGNLQQFFYTFFFGTLLAFIYVKTGKIRYTIMLHMLVNSLSLFLTWLLTKVPLLNSLASGSTEVVKKLFKDDTQLVYFIILSTITLMEYVFAFIGLIVLVTHLRDFSFGEDNENRAGLGKCWGNPGMLIMFVFLCAIMILPIFDIDIFDMLYYYLSKWA